MTYASGLAAAFAVSIDIFPTMQSSPTYKFEIIGSRSLRTRLYRDL